MLGERTVNGRLDRDRIDVGRRQPRFSRLTLVVLDSDLELLGFEVRFARGAPFRPELRHIFRENDRTRVIDLPGDDRTIRALEFTYKNRPGNGNAKVQVWAK